MQTFFNNRDQDISGHCNPDLRLHGVLARAVKSFEPQVLLDPFEEQLDLPALTVKSGDCGGGQRHVVGQKHNGLALVVLDLHAPHHLRISLGSRVQRQRTRLIEHHVGACPVYGMRITPFELRIALGSRDKEASRCLNRIQTREVQIASIHKLDSARFDRQVVQHIDRCVQIHAQRVVRVQRTSQTNQGLTQVGVDLPRVRGVRIGQRVARDGVAAKAHVIQARSLSPQIDLDVPQALAVGELCEGHCKELIQTSEVLDFAISAVAFDATGKGGLGQVRHELRKNEFALMHWSPWRSKAAKRANYWFRVSNRHQKKSSIYANNSLTYTSLA